MASGVGALMGGLGLGSTAAAGCKWKLPNVMHLNCLIHIVQILELSQEILTWLAVCSELTAAR